MYFTVYETRNIVTGMIYVGAHATEYPNDGYLGSGPEIKKAIKQYGPESFVKTVLFIFDSESEALRKEKEIINAEFVKRSDTYNKICGGTKPPSPKGIPKSDISRQKMSTAKTGKPPWNKGIKFSPEQCQKISRSLKGVPLSESHIESMSAARKGKPWSAARRAVVEESTKKTSAKTKGRPWTDAQRTARLNYFKSKQQSNPQEDKP